MELRRYTCRIFFAVTVLLAAIIGVVLWATVFRKGGSSSPDPVTGGDGIAPLLQDSAGTLDVPGMSNAEVGWQDSYSAGDRCYCQTTFDHGIGSQKVKTPKGVMTVKEACDMLGPGPGAEGRPLYNDVQCGNGPANNEYDEINCPGRVEYGKEGCKYIGPKWNFAA